MLVPAPPQLSPSKLVHFLKGRSSRLLQREFPALGNGIGDSIFGRGLSLRERPGGRENGSRLYREPAVRRRC